MDQEKLNALLDLLIKKNPDAVNNPRAKSMIEVLRSGDKQKGEELANNLCSTYGVSKEEGINQAMSWVQSLLGGGK